METFNKKWYQSKKFWLALAGALIPLLNQYTGLNLPAEQIQMIIGILFAGIVVEGGLDAQRQNSATKLAAAAAPDFTAIQLPMIREILDSLVNDEYNYQTARTDGISEHARQIWERVMQNIQVLITPDLYELVKADEQIHAEVMRQIFKKYNQDISMSEGAELATRAR